VKSGNGLQRVMSQYLMDGLYTCGWAVLCLDLLTDTSDRSLVQYDRMRIYITLKRGFNIKYSLSWIACIGGPYEKCHRSEELWGIHARLQDLACHY